MTASQHTSLKQFVTQDTDRGGPYDQLHGIVDDRDEDDDAKGFPEEAAPTRG